MPLLGIVVLLILLFLRRELIPRQIENDELRIESFGTDGGEKPEAQEPALERDSPPARPQARGDGGALGESAPPEQVESGKLKVKSDGEPDGEAPPEASAGENAPAARPQPDEESGTPGESASPERVESGKLKVESDGEPGGEAPPAARAGGNAPAARPQSGEEGGAPGESAPPAETAKPEAREPVAKEWPKFTLSGIAVGRERLAMLSTGEMLTAGEVAKCGVKVEKVESASVVFSWRGETKTLRKGEQSDKPADAPNAPGNL